MRHNQHKVKLGRKTKEQRTALVKSLVTQLFTHSAITTTLPKAKAAQPLAERLIARAKKESESFNQARTAKSLVYTKEASKKAVDFAKATPKNSGFTRIIPLKVREGDGAKMARLELVE
jgi:large subunit ribosomal protein L17